MSEFKHTPGPWECDGDLVHKDGFQIAIVESHYEDYVELQQANARLIAAAPELLEALQHIQRCIPLGGFAQIHHNSSTWSQIDAAIAKATGETE